MERELVAEVVCPRCLKPECYRAGEKQDPVDRIFKNPPPWGPCEQPAYRFVAIDEVSTLTPEQLLYVGAMLPGKTNRMRGR